MSRPCIYRKVCREPDYDTFFPEGIINQELVTLTVDEFETIRLIDYEKKTQEECAKVMQISRTTITSIYEKARYKIADSIVNGKALHIEGGNYQLCDGNSSYCWRNECEKRHILNDKNEFHLKGELVMRIAVTYEEGQVYQHFGHTEQFKIYDVENNKIVNTQIVSTNGQGHGALAGFLLSGKVDFLICGGIGGGAQNALMNAGIKIFGGVSGNADEVVNDFINGTLNYNPNVKCSHHENNHECGDHGCGEHHFGNSECK